MLGLWVFKRMVGHVAINHCIFVMRWLAKGEAWTMLLLHLCRKDSSSKHCASSSLRPSPRHHPREWVGGGGDLLEAWRMSSCPASNLESLPPSTSPLLFDEEDPLSEPEGNIAASSSEPTVGESLAFPASNSEDVLQYGNSVKGNVKAPPQTPQSTSSSNPPQVMMPVHTCSSVRSPSGCPRRTQRA